ncbi:hypothetical protein OS493_031665 [Desmophyllum pertusum]|uniref:Cadherin domain-containing protein n=1 Tax=Desmophyllum pertusum TaxID=174260 RepID=A0A9W9ZWZ4_9CNID|nr:hypothetical protein OS493_031665 [Desmophyllum pertusum]
MATFCNIEKGEGVYFTKSIYQAQVDESSPPGTYVTTVQALDQSGNPSDQITYSLTKENGWYKINSTSGVITVAKTLDREEMADTQNFDALATKIGESQAGKATIYCTVLDLNDNYPQFENLPYQVNISENTKVGEVVIEVSASDKDSADNHNNEVYYKIVGGNTEGTFEIATRNKKGIITLSKPLDFKVSQKYYLNVTATDESGAPTGNQNWTVVTIGVIDADDLAATFSKFLYPVLINVNTGRGREIVRVHAEDQDSLQAPVSYAIFRASDPEEYFKINNITGSITVNRNLTRDSYPFIVTAKSSNHPAAFALVVVNAVAMPNRTFEASVMENEANTTVFDLKPLEQYFNVSDPIFQIHQSDEGDKFFINGTSKELKVGAQALDREERDKYTVVVELLSNGDNKGYAMIIISVLDANDNSPKFQNPASVSAREDTSTGSVVLTVKANDRDAGQNGTVVYNIVAGNEKGFFALNNQSGALTLIRPLDYESADQHVLNISAFDMGEPHRQAFRDVTIHVTDANDNSPVLQARIVRASVVEGAASGSFVAQCNATDADVGANAQVTYHLVEGAANKFSINNITGVITTSGIFDRETDPEEYTLVIKAQDNGQHPRSDVGFVIVNVININDHSPVFSPVSYIGGVYKETTYYSLVTTVKARDGDSDSKSTISFKLINGNGAGLFHVEPDTGHVRVATSLADKDGTKYTLEISASDGGKKSTTNAIVDVFVLRDEDSIVMKAGVIPEEITKNRQEFLGMLETITGGKAFIKYLRQENEENATVVTFHAVKGEQVMSGFQIIR